MTRTFALLTTSVLTLAVPAAAQQYTARRSGDIVTLEDTRSQTTLSILTSVGNMAYSMKIKGQDVLRFPFASVDDFRSRPNGLHGIPLLAP